MKLRTLSEDISALGCTRQACGRERAWVEEAQQPLQGQGGTALRAAPFSLGSLLSTPNSLSTLGQVWAAAEWRAAGRP